MQRALNIITTIGYLVAVVATGLIAVTLPGPVRVDMVADVIPCSTDTECVTLNPHIAPDEYTADDYLRVHGRPGPVQDAVAEGLDVLMLNGSATPADLWNGLVDRTEWYDDHGTNGNGTFYVPVGTVVDVPGGVYLATMDGWTECRDDWFAVECSATGPVYLTSIPWHVSDHGDACAVAAGLLLDAVSRSARIEEDLSYRGMSDIEAMCNDQLATAYYEGGRNFNGEHDPAALVPFLQDRAQVTMPA